MNLVYNRHALFFPKTIKQFKTSPKDPSLGLSWKVDLPACADYYIFCSLRRTLEPPRSLCTSELGRGVSQHHPENNTPAPKRFLAENVLSLRNGCPGRELRTLSAHPLACLALQPRGLGISFLLAPLRTLPFACSLVCITTPPSRRVSVRKLTRSESLLQSPHDLL